MIAREGKNLFEQSVVSDRLAMRGFVEPGGYVMSRLPSQAELEQLPLRAIVAFAARYARRVLPLCRFNVSDADLPSGIEAAVRIAERLAAGRAGFIRA